MKLIDKKTLINKIHDRFGGALSKLIILDSVQIICEEFNSKLVEQESLSIKNFGTFHTYQYWSHKSMDISSGNMRMTKPFLSISFIPHKNFYDLISQKKTFFSEKKD